MVVAIRVPSGDHAGTFASSAGDVSKRTSLPSTFCTTRGKGEPEKVLWMYATFVPSGDKAGPLSENKTPSTGIGILTGMLLSAFITISSRFRINAMRPLRGNSDVPRKFCVRLVVTFWRIAV